MQRLISSTTREGDPKGWSTVLITALGIWENPVPRGHSKTTRKLPPV